jgi:hypothetical protein
MLCTRFTTQHMPSVEDHTLKNRHPTTQHLSSGVKNDVEKNTSAELLWSFFQARSDSHPGVSKPSLPSIILPPSRGEDTLTMVQPLESIESGVCVEHRQRTKRRVIRNRRFNITEAVLSSTERQRAISFPRDDT